MFYDVCIKNKITNEIITNGECTENDINFWKQKAITTSINLGIPTILRLEPKAVEFEYYPKTKLIPSPKQTLNSITNQITDPALAAQFEGS